MKRKLAVIMAADVAGYTRLIAEDEEETLRRFESYSGVFEEFVDRSGGRIFNTAGDAILSEFQSAVEAVRCAVDVQESLRARNHAYPPSRQMLFRIGITIGDVVERGGDLVGDGVNIASRLESVAPPGGICVSRSVHEAVATKMLVRFADAGLQDLKNIPDPVHAYMVSLETVPGQEQPTTKSKAVEAKPNSVTKTRAMPTFNKSALVPALVIVGTAVAGLFYAKPDLLGSQEDPPPPVVATPEPEPATSTATAPAPAPSPSAGTTAPQPAPKTEGHSQPPADSKKPIDSLEAKYLLTRQWQDCLQSDDADRLVDACKAVIDHGGLEPNDKADIYYRYGRGLRDQGKPELAIEAYAESIRAKPTALAYAHRGIAYFDQNDFTRSVADYDEALRLDPTSAETANNRAWTLFKSGNFNDALAGANQAIRLDGSKAYAWDTRGHIYEARGNADLAASDFRKALSLDPALESSREGLKRLGR